MFLVEPGLWAWWVVLCDGAGAGAGSGGGGEEGVLGGRSIFRNFLCAIHVDVPVIGCRAVVVIAACPCPVARGVLCLQVGVGDVVFWEVVADDADAGGASPRNGSFCALNVGLGDCGSADAAAELRTSIHVTLDDQQRGAPMYRLRLSWDEGLPAGDSTSVSEPFRLFIVPGAVTLLPVVITVITAVWTKDVILSLYAGVYFASLLTTNYNPFDAFVRSLDTYILGSIVDSDHATILLFTWLIAGMIACMIKAGGGGGLVLALSRHAKTPRGGSFLVACLSFMIFFDDCKDLEVF